MTNDAVQVVRRGNWESLPEPFRDLKYKELVDELGAALDVDQRRGLQ